MIAPGSKGWINKFFNLHSIEDIREQVVSSDQVTDDEFLHFRLLESGIVFGYPAALIFSTKTLISQLDPTRKVEIYPFRVLTICLSTGK